MTRLRWGVKTAPNTRRTTRCSKCGGTPTDAEFEHAWLFDHFNPIQGDLDGPCFEGWTLLSALAAQTSRLRLGLMVAGNTTATLPSMLTWQYGGRDLGRPTRIRIGAGWNEYEHQSMGIPLYPGERIRRLGEACEITRRL
jgi:alkanesulfonate monooxygenase SsuD/methylene tetrahydromethanopterin reductase-like flavin-dependent oxidoreductase (luciferase family)